MNTAHGQCLARLGRKSNRPEPSRSLAEVNLDFLKDQRQLLRNIALDSLIADPKADSTLHASRTLSSLDAWIESLRDEERR
jgi:hypothetical protein